MSNNQGNKLSRIGIGIFFILAIAYGFFEARWVLLGPAINIFTDMSPTTSAFIRIQGRMDHINTASLNGMPLTVTENGIFDEGYALVPGVNQLYFDATDRYGHMTRTRTVIVYIPVSYNCNRIHIKHYYHTGFKHHSTCWHDHAP
jgi:hypothetical protein